MGDAAWSSCLDRFLSSSPTKHHLKFIGIKTLQNCLHFLHINRIIVQSTYFPSTVGAKMTQPEPPPTNSESAAVDSLLLLAAGSEAADVARRVIVEALERSSIILYNWDLLGKILDRHEAALQNRWIKKSTTWRKTILSKAWPDMPLFHRPDISHLSKESTDLLE